jgi:hypothetical protein
MSNHLAIATVTAALRSALLAALQADVPGAEVTTLRPSTAGGAGLPGLGVNLFLYRVQPNDTLRNADLPTRRPDGEVMRAPRVALDLDFLLSFHGADATLEPQRLLGSAARTLHAHPQLTEAGITATVADPAVDFLAGSDLARQVERVRFSPLALSLEDLSKLWSVFFQVPYVLSMAYRAGVVLIESKATARPALPVREYTVHPHTLTRPQVERIESQAGGDASILPQSAIRIRGRHLQGEVMEVLLAGTPVTPTLITDSHIELILPAGLKAGVNGVQICQGILAGSPPVAHRSGVSELAGFVLHPALSRTTAGSYDIGIHNLQGAGTASRSATISVGLVPAVDPRQRVTLELLEPSGLVHTYLGADLAAAGNRVDFPVVGLAPGEYLARIRVDGAESLLELDATQQPRAPKVVLQ